jgi:nitrite reductase (NO-forming)
VNVSRILGLMLAVVLVVGAGCGGGGDSNKDTTAATTTETTKTTEPAGGAETTSVTLDEYQFDPGDVVAKRGGTIEVKNDGNIVHNLTIEKGPDPRKKSDKLAGTPTFGPGKTEKLEVDLSPGKYAMVCTVAGHRELGMTGTFTVK